jgi:hypothetical protein
MMKPGKPSTQLVTRREALAAGGAVAIGLSLPIADPLFVDPAGGDFSLKPDSPAIKLGFKPIDINTAGPRNRKDWGKD